MHFQGFFMLRNAFAAGASLRTPLGELPSLPKTLFGGEGARCPSSKTEPPLSAFALDLWPLGPQSAIPAPIFGYAYGQRITKQNHQALLKAKYCPWVAAALCTQRNPQNSCDLDL